MAEELKPCPFCGGEPNLTHSDYVHDDLRPMPVVECKSCSAWVRAEDWNTRAQLPSQVGEAVAWQVIGVYPKHRHPHKTIESCAKTAEGQAAHWRNRGCTVEITPLYTHPADQVADDLTMVKVSRELLEDLRDLAFDQVEHHRAAMGAYKQTRQSAMDSVLAQADALLRT